MITLDTLVYNSFSVNTYILSDEEHNCIVVDPGCYTTQEKNHFDEYIAKRKLKISKVLITHCHIDHVLGISHLEDKYNMGASIHPEGVEFLRASVGYASMFGFDLERTVKAKEFINEGDLVMLDDNRLEFLYTPGHADGSLCIVCHHDKFVITGDVLFAGGIGRTDLPTGDFQLLMDSIHNKLMTLPEDYRIYPGHGPDSTIGYEKNHNEFLF